MAEVDKYLLGQLYKRFAKAIGDRELTPGTVIAITAIAMMIVERQKNMTGDEKKALALALLHKLADETEMEDNDREALHLLIDSVAPGAIDAIISASKKEFDLNKAKSRWEWFRKNCCCCCSNNA
jgi:hypothetical protein